MQKTMNQAELRFQNLINEAPFSAALLSGNDLIVEMANEISLKLWGKDSSIIGKPLVEAIPEIKGQAVFEALVNVYRTGITYEGKENTAYLEVDGVLKKVFVNFVYKAIHDDEGEIVSVLAAGFDVTEHVEMRKKLFESEERTRLTVDAAGIGTFDYDYKTERTITSPRFDAIFGFEEPKLRPSYVHVIHPEDLPIREAAQKKSLASGSLEYEVRLIWPDKSIHWVRVKGKVFFDNHQMPVRLLGTALDVTEQKLAIKKLEESEQRFRILITETPEVGSGLYIGRELRIQYVNDVMIKFWGKDSSVINKTFREALPDLEGQPFFDQLDKVYTTGVAFTGKEVKASFFENGKIRSSYYNYTYKALRNSGGEIYGVHHMAVDVTEQVLNKQKYIASEKRFRHLLMQAPFGICILKGKNFIVEFSNDIFLQMVDRKHEEYVGKPLWEGLPEIKDQIFNKLLREVLRTGTTFHGKEYKVKIKRHGIIETVYVDFTYEPLKNEEGETDTILVLAIDVTDKVLGRTEVEKSRDNFNAILESLPQMAWTADSNGNLVFITEQYYDYTGHIANAALGNGWTKALSPEEADGFIAKWHHAVKKGEFFEAEARLKKFNGENRWHLVRAVPILDNNNNISLWVGTSTDIHDQKLFSEELEKKIKERTKELEWSNNELEQFAYVSSHDMQEPLRKITIFTDLLRKSLGEIPEKPQTYLQKISDSSSRMLNLIKDVLEFSRLTKSERIYVPVDLEEVLKNVVNDFDLLIEQKNAKIDIGPLTTIDAIPLQINQLFHNLLSNSLKFLSPDRKLSISVRMQHMNSEEVAQHGDLNPNLTYIQIAWEDNGIGFAEKYADKIFVIFQRLNERESYTGTGIGLALCKKIITNHHGEISVKSEIDKGSTFYIILPAKLSKA
jgi:PAS domain S-box-containing protein